MQFRIKIKATGKLKAPKVTTAEYRELGNAMVANMKKRIARGINADNMPAAPLSPLYAKYKARARHTRRPIRDMFLTGLTLGSYQVQRAWGGVIRAERSNQTARKRAFINQHLEPMFGFTDSEAEAVVKRARQLFGRKIE